MYDCVIKMRSSVRESDGLINERVFQQVQREYGGGVATNICVRSTNKARRSSYRDDDDNLGKGKVTRYVAYLPGLCV